MTLDSLIAQISSLGYTLLLHGPMHDRRPGYAWEATIRRPLSDDPLTHAVGFHVASDPTSAILHALSLCENDFETSIWTPQVPTCAPLPSMLDQLQALVQPAPLTLSAPKFKLNRSPTNAQ